MMFGIIDFPEYFLGLIAIILLPGPNSLYVLSVAAKCGVRKGYQGAFGIFFGDLILMTLASVGMASLLRTTSSLFVVIKVVGALYLAWLGISMLRASLQRFKRARYVEQDVGTVMSSTQTELSFAHPFRRALGISLVNPKAILFFVAFFIQFVDKHYEYPALSFMILGAVCQVVSLLYLSAVIFIGVKLAKAFEKRKKLAASVVAGVGLLFLGFAVKLATASLN